MIQNNNGQSTIDTEQRDFNEFFEGLVKKTHFIDEPFLPFAKMLISPGDYASHPCNFVKRGEHFLCAHCAKPGKPFKCPPIIDALTQSQSTEPRTTQDYSACDTYGQVTSKCKTDTQSAATNNPDSIEDQIERQIWAPDYYNMGTLGILLLSKQEKTRYRHSQIMAQLMVEQQPSSAG